MIKNKIKKINPRVLLFIGGVILTIGDILAALWIKSGYHGLYIIIFFLYLISMMILIESYQKVNVPVASTILVIFNVVTLFFAGILFFGESLNAYKVLGILLCFVSLFLLEFGKRK